MVNFGTCGIEKNCQQCHFDPIEIHVKKQTRLGCGKLSRVDQLICASGLRSRVLELKSYRREMKQCGSWMRGCRFGDVEALVDSLMSFHSSMKGFSELRVRKQARMPTSPSDQSPPAALHVS